MRLWEDLRREAVALIDFCFPPACLLCGGAVPPADDDPELCAVCRHDFPRLSPPYCPRCALPFATIGGRNHPCGTCLLQPPPFDWTLAAGLYEASLRRAVQDFKFNHGINLDRPLARTLLARWEESAPPWEPELLVPVPLHRSRLQRRTYNQARLLAQELGRMQRLPVADILERTRATSPQPGLTVRERRENLAGAFTCRGGLAGEKVLLVDDVMTTGATARACAAVLRAQGAGAVAVAVLARARRNPHYPPPERDDDAAP